jgi:hypothetical protein
MNPRIKELAEQAGYTPLPGFDFANELQEVFLNKFAELIVEECANVADENYIHRGSRTCGLAIRLHFGVEE